MYMYVSRDRSGRWGNFPLDVCNATFRVLHFFEHIFPVVHISPLDEVTMKLSECNSFPRVALLQCKVIRYLQQPQFTMYTDSDTSK